MSRHEGVSCDSCLKSNFTGPRYKCLICYDYDLCATCYISGSASSSHSTDHAVQCILTRTDLNLYYGGDSSMPSQLQSYTCSYCGRMGFTVVLLQEHIRANHGDVLSVEVVCPVCASHPGGDPNHVTDDLATHIALVHRSGVEFEDDQLSGIRQIRRLTHPVRTSNFGSRPNRGPVMQLIEPPSTGLSPTGRDVMDPIAELLSQLTSVRNRAAITQGMTSHLQQIEMHLASAKHQSERLSQRQSESSKTGSTQQTRTATSEAQPTTAKSTSAPSGGSSATNSHSQFLLSRCTDKSVSESKKQRQELENADISLFVQELLLSSLAEGFGGEHEPLEPTTHLDSILPCAAGRIGISQTESDHSMNGRSVATPYPAAAKSCETDHSANDRLWDFANIKNCNNVADSSDEDDGDDNDEEVVDSSKLL